MNTLLASSPAATVTRLLQLVESPAASAVVRENWKYTPVARGIELAGAKGGSEQANAIEGADQPGIRLEAAAMASATDVDLLIGRALTCPPSARALLLANAVDRLVITGTPANPVRIVRQNAQRPLLIKVAAGASVILEDVAEGSASGWLQIHVQDGAHLDFSRLRTGRDTSDWQQLGIRLERDAGLRMQHYATGSTLRRLDARIQLAGVGAHADLSGCWTAAGREKLDQQWHVEHLAPHTQSRQIHHGIGDDHATTTFRGRIFIDVACHGVSADLVNRNLALAAGVTCNTKPELEIHNDDVRCSHGATVGQLPEESVFYLRSRGLDFAAARALLAAGFIRSCIRGSLSAEAELALTGSHPGESGA